MRVLLSCLLAVSALMPPLAVVSAQAPCRAPAPAPSAEPNFFSAAQESDLGDAVAERYEASLRVIADETLTAHLRRIGERLVSHLPATQLRIQFQLIDIPDVNAFVLPGGRVYVSRKLVGFAENEDEVAAVLGHELGHLIARQQTIEMSRQLREVIGVTVVGDRQDIFEKYNRLVDNAARKPGAFRTASREDRDQLEADRIGLFVVAAAGYDPQAHVRMFDRVAATQGATGSFVSKMFGTTNPDVKRLGELMKTAASLPPGCAETRTPADAQAFQAWQRALVNFSGLGRTESIHGLVSRTTISPALRGEVTHVRFSPDGRSLLAQDDGGIAVLSREPLAMLFRIDAPDAEPAQFTPDSREVLFHTPSLRIERWRVDDRARVMVRDLARRTRCLNAALGPDGRFLACVDSALELSLIDVASGATLLQKKDFYPAKSANLVSQMTGVNLAAQGGGHVPLKFSPDGRFFASGYEDLGTDVAIVYDFETRAVVPLKSPAKRLLTGSFAFVSPDRVVGSNPRDPGKSGIFTLPAGDVVDQFALPAGDFEAPTKGNYLLVRPYQRYAVGVLDLSTKTVTKGNALVAFDMYEQTFAAERNTGDLGLYAVAGNQLVASVSLPPGQLGQIHAAAVSADFAWLAVSERSRGAVWDLARSERAAHIRGFDGAWFDELGLFFADLPKAGSEPRAVMRLNPAQRQVSNAGTIHERFAEQYGRWLLVMTTLPENVMYAQGATYQLRDVRRPTALWSRAFPKDPPEAWVSSGSDAVVFSWDAASPAGRELIRKDPELRTSVKLGDIDGDYVLEIVDAETGVLRRRMLLETGKGSFSIERILVAGDWLVISDSVGRVLVHSVKTGEISGHAFGSDPAISQTAGLLAVDAGAGRLVLYDLKSMHRRDDFTFAHRIALKAFSPDGKRLFVLTADQTAFVLDVSRQGIETR